jgi:hypothetical protein
VAHLLTDEPATTAGLGVRLREILRGMSHGPAHCARASNRCSRSTSSCLDGPATCRPPCRPCSRRCLRRRHR